MEPDTAEAATSRWPCVFPLLSEGAACRHGPALACGSAKLAEVIARAATTGRTRPLAIRVVWPMRLFWRASRFAPLARGGTGARHGVVEHGWWE